MFAPTPAAADEILSFSLGNTTYTIASLLSRLQLRPRTSRQLGGGITCEPANVISCQSHLQAALSITNAGAKASNKDTKCRKTWQKYLLTENIAKGWIPSALLPLANAFSR